MSSRRCCCPGRPLGFVAILGILALIGMITKNAVILIGQIEAEREQGKDVQQAAIDASTSRFRPIMLTAVSTVLGMIPIAPTVFWGPMAFAIMGGLLVATILTLVFLPTLYVTWFGWRRVASSPRQPARGRVSASEVRQGGRRAQFNPRSRAGGRFLGFWLILAGDQPADLLVGLMAARRRNLGQPRSCRRTRAAAVLSRSTRLCAQLSAPVRRRRIDVAWRALHPRLPLRPGFVHLRLHRRQGRCAKRSAP